MLESLKEAAAVQKRRLGQKLLNSPLHPLYVKLVGAPQVREYRRFVAALARNNPPREWFSQQMTRWNYRPRVTILLASRNSNPGWFRQAVDSLFAQIYPYWELCIADDASDHPLTPPSDPRISFTRLESQSGISGALNRALEMSTGEYIGVLDHDDFFSNDALYRFVETLQHEKYPVLYSDEEYVDEKGDPVRPSFKPDWSPELLSNCMYVGHLVLASRERMNKIGGFRSEFDGAQDYDLALRLTDEPVRVAHVPHILYHWRQHSESIAHHPGAKPWAHDAGHRALEDMIRRRGWDAEVADGPIPTRYRVIRKLQDSGPVSIVVSHRTHKSFERFLCDLEQHTDRDFEIVEEAATATGAYLVFLHDDVRPQSPDWLTILLAVAQRPGVGAAGAKLVYPNGAIQHSGIVAGMFGSTGHPGRRIYESDNWRWLDYTRNVTAVSSACLVTRRGVFEKMGGFDNSLAPDYADVDYCLRLREAGFEVILEPRASLVHDEAHTAGEPEKQRALFREKWRDILEQPDPYYSRYLTLDREDTALRTPSEIVSDAPTRAR